MLLNFLNMSAKNWIERLSLEAHPEGGYYKEVYRNSATIQLSGGGGTRNLATSIYFLLAEGQKSHFHQLNFDELWYFQQGDPVTVHIFDAGEYRKEILGPEEGQLLQVLLPAKSIFAAEVASGGSFCLMGCMVNPGFDFKDFRMVSSGELIREFPKHKELINQFTLEA